MRILFPRFTAATAYIWHVSGLVTIKRIWDRNTFRALQQQQCAPPQTLETNTCKNKAGFIREEFSFRSNSGDHIPVLAMIPEGATSPAIILLYGSGMNMKVADKLAESVTQAGFSLFVPEQFGRGLRKQRGLKSWQKLLAVRHRVLLTIKETYQLTDLLKKRTDIDPQRIYLWGVSFGAMTGCAAIAYDQHLKAAVFTLSGGNLQKIVADTPYRKKIPRFSWMKIAAPVLASLLRPFDPIWHIGQIHPRPVLFQNALYDELIPRSGVDALHQAAGASKEIMWYDNSHNHQSLPSIEQLVRDALTWLSQQDRLITLHMHKAVAVI